MKAFIECKDLSAESNTDGYMRIFRTIMLYHLAESVNAYIASKLKPTVHMKIFWNQRKFKVHEVFTAKSQQCQRSAVQKIRGAKKISSAEYLEGKSWE